MGLFSNPSNHHLLTERFMQYWLTGNLAGTVAYGVAITLSGNCLLLLSRSNATSIRTRRWMMALVGCMCLISTSSFLSSAGGAVIWAANPGYDAFDVDQDNILWGIPFCPMELILIVFATWISDGFMVCLFSLSKCLIYTESKSRSGAVSCCITECLPFFGCPSWCL